MTGVRIAYLVVLAVCIFASGFFSGSETALISIPRERARQLEGDGRGRLLARLISDPDRMLSTLLVANNFVNILAAAIATALFIDLAGEDWGPWIATIAMTAVILLFGEVTPKSLAARYPEQFSLAVAPTIWRLSYVLRPISRVFQSMASGLFRLLGVSTQAPQSAVTEEDILAMADLGEEGGEIESAEREIIHSVFELADRPVREVMTPRVEIVTLTHPVTATDVRTVVADTGHSRFPVIGEDLDELVGVAYAKDFLALDDVTTSQPGDLIRTPVYVPESRDILSLLQEMQAARWGMAIVTDEHGGVEGLVTVKDLVSELTGELQDEYDPGAPAVTSVSPGTWVADGRASIEELAEALGRELPEGEYSTAGGLYLDVAGRIPGEGDTIDIDGLNFTVLEMDRNRIDRIRIER